MLFLLHSACVLWRGVTSYLTPWSVCPPLCFPTFAHTCDLKKNEYLCFVLLSLWMVMPVRLHAGERALVGTQVQSSSSVLILRVLTVSIESSWQLKEEHKIGKWGGVSKLRPLPPHSSLAEDVWIYSGNATFERNKWDGRSFLLCVLIPSSGVSLCCGVQHRVKGGESGLGSCSAPFLACMSL